MDVAETPFSRLTLCEDGILEAHPIQRDAPRNAALIAETMDALEAVAGGKARPVLWDPAGTLPLQPDGWRMIVDRVGLAGAIAAIGILIDADEAHLLGAFPETMNALLIPVRSFDDEASAREWLLQFVETGEGV
ncbi:MAG: hypothetical protein QNJ89_09815 [Acidimicrobiia bacterium]|nr:hypothetical protein [Acidimicrobiia bacterium]